MNEKWPKKLPRLLPSEFALLRQTFADTTDYICPDHLCLLCYLSYLTKQKKSLIRDHVLYNQVIHDGLFHGLFHDTFDKVYFADLGCASQSCLVI